MPDETKLEEQQEEPKKTLVSGSNVTAILFGGILFGVVVACGVLNILAAKGRWNPFRWQGRFWTGILMIAAPSVLGIAAALPYRIRSKIPESALGITVVLVWIAFFWATCGGH